jgi:hypothetical protein
MSKMTGMELPEALGKIATALEGWDGKTDTITIDPLPIIVLFLAWDETRKYLTESMELSDKILNTFSETNKSIQEALHE